MKTSVLVTIATLVWALTAVTVQCATAPNPPCSYDVVGPFPVGQREIGGDILEAFGGIYNIPRGGDLTYPSELADGGRVGWSQFYADSSNNVLVNFTAIRWDFLQQPFGWAATNFGAWAIGDFYVQENGRFLVSCANVDHFYIDQVKYQGDLYGLGYAYSVVDLKQGNNTLYIRLQGMETATFSCSFSAIESAIVVLNDDIVPDNVDGVLAGNYISIPILNTSPNSLKNITVSIDGVPVRCDATFNPTVLPGQSHPLAITVSQLNDTIACGTFLATITGFVGTLQVSVAHNVSFGCSHKNSIFKLTFLDADSSVQYAMTYPPKAESCNATNECYVLLTTHGAGSKAEWLIPFYQQQPRSWVLAPSGRRRFGFDWEGQQMLSAFAALQQLPHIDPRISNGRIPNIQKILYAGHSMGGHGCFQISGHYADYALGIAAAAGWIKYEQYIPYFVNIGYSFMDAMLKGILAASLTEYSPDLYATNVIGIPFLARAGGADEDVSPFHPRRMVRIVDQLSHNATYGIMSEVPGMPHWWGGVVDDATMQAFFDQQINNTNANYPPLPAKFTITCANPARFGTRGGIKILQLKTPYRVGRVHVERVGAVWHLKTENIRRLGFKSLQDMEFPNGGILIDGQSFPQVSVLNGAHYCRESDKIKVWSLCKGDQWQNTERGPLTYGPARQVFESPVIIVYGTQGDSDANTATYNQAVYLSNHFYVQENSGILIMKDVAVDLMQLSQVDTNLILLGGPEHNAVTSQLAATNENWPVKFSKAGFTIGQHTFGADDLGLQFLAPFQGTKLALVVAGTSTKGLKLGFDLFPVKSGMMIPDYLIVDEEIKWKAEGGILAAGYWGNLWEYRMDTAYLRE